MRKGEKFMSLSSQKKQGRARDKGAGQPGSLQSTIQPTAKKVSFHQDQPPSLADAGVLGSMQHTDTLKKMKSFGNENLSKNSNLRGSSADGRMDAGGVAPSGMAGFGSTINALSLGSPGTKQTYQ